MRGEACPLVWRDAAGRDERARAGADDDALVLLVRAGDSRAFDTLFHRHQDYVYNICYGVLGRAETARDVTQEVFLQVHRSLGSFRRGARFSTWLFRIAVNRAVDVARSESRRQHAPIDGVVLEAVDPSPGPQQMAEREDESDEIRRVMGLIPPRHRDVLVLRYFQSMTIDEMAEVLGCGVQAAKVRLHRARQQFREKYEALNGTYGRSD